MDSPIAPIHSLTLDLPPSCIEFCPEHPSYFCVGTYSLVQDEHHTEGDRSRPQSRHGSIVVFRLEGTTVCRIESIPQPSAILDLHFQPTEGRKDIFAVASSTASLSIFRLLPASTSTSTLQSIGTARVSGVGEDILFLSCAWHPSIPDIIAVSTSSGHVYVMATSEVQSTTVVSRTTVLTHDLETWTIAFSPTTSMEVPISHAGDETDEEGYAEGSAGGNSVPTTLYSGSDNSLLKYTSCALGASPVNGTDVQFNPLSGTCKLADHNAGVTAILPTTAKGTDGGRIVITGSYDDHIRVFSISDPGELSGRRQVTRIAEKNLGGGVWRLKLVSHTSNGQQWNIRVLASCMHAGARVIDICYISSGACEIKTAARFEEHKSMNYGSDFQQQGSLLCVSTSFYDKLLCLWEVKGDR